MSQTNTKATKAKKAATKGNRQDAYDCLEPWDDNVVFWRVLDIRAKRSIGKNGLKV